MLYTPATRQALTLCCDAHAEHVDKAELPYFTHPLHLAEQMETEAEICAALLHDVLEDSALTPHELLIHSIPVEAINAVILLTHDEGVPYFDYIQAIKDGDFSGKEPLSAHSKEMKKEAAKIARKVKCADLHHNSNLGRLSRVTSRDIKRLEKYQKALVILEDLTHKLRTPLGSFKIKVNGSPYPFRIEEHRPSNEEILQERIGKYFPSYPISEQTKQNPNKRDYYITVDTLALKPNDIVTATYDFKSAIVDYHSDENAATTIYQRGNVIISVAAFTHNKYRYSSDYPYQLTNRTGTYKITNDPIEYRSFPHTRFITYRLSWGIQ